MEDARRYGLDLTADDLDPQAGTGVWPKNVDAVTAFLAVQSQWRVVSMPDGSLRSTGLDYGGVKAGLKMSGIKMKPGLWAELRVIERAARAEMNGGRQ
ncbi:DUF1799 domain-containing protein [Profundibacter sp.]